MNILHEILDSKRVEVKAKKKSVPLSELQAKQFFKFRRLSLGRALRNSKLGIIGEIKKASPSKGVLRNNFDALALARQYCDSGASALSVLTDEKYFQGDLRYIECMKNFVTIPMLRKDFIIDAYQLYESKSAGADAILLIASALDASQLHDLHDEAIALDLECLVEVHSRQEIESLDFNKVSLVGINNRNLETFETSISISGELRQYIPANVEVVSESGIRSATDIKHLMALGINSFLIGETFMLAENPGECLSTLREQVLGAMS